MEIEWNEGRGASQVGMLSFGRRSKPQAPKPVADRSIVDLEMWNMRQEGIDSAAQRKAA
jgi:hypothetical protein